MDELNGFRWMNFPVAEGHGSRSGLLTARCVCGAGCRSISVRPDVWKGFLRETSSIFQYIFVCFFIFRRTLTSPTLKT